MITRLFDALTFHTIPTFNDPENKAFENIVSKKRICW